MTERTITRDQARLIDARAVSDYGMHSAMLMESAGRGVADVLCALGIDGPVAICCGAGNNGGDGYVVARYLEARGNAVRVLALADPARLRGDAALNCGILQRSGVPIVRPTPDEIGRCLTDCAWIVDALLGTGARGEPRFPIAEAIAAINVAGKRVLAVDVPSGLDCDTGLAARQTIVADLTCTFVASKPGFLAPEAGRYLGRLQVIDIGVPRKLIDEVLGNG
jgi:NAD(P)H-hydrate epimerase